MSFQSSQSKVLVIFLVLCLFVAVLAWLEIDFAATVSVGEKTRWPSQRELYRKLRDIRKVLLVYGTGNPETAAAYQKQAQAYAESTRWLGVIVKPDTAVTSAELKSLPLSLIGSPSSNRVLRDMLPRLPLSVKQGKVSVDNLMTLHSDDVYYLSLYPNPNALALPVSVTTGSDDTSILHAFAESERHFYSAGDFWISRHYQKSVLGFFEQERGNPWTINHSRTRNYIEERHTVAETQHFSFIYHGKAPPNSIHEFIQKEEKRTQRLLAELKRAGFELSALRRMEYHLYSSAEDKGLITRNTDLSHHDLRTHSVHTLFTPELKGDDFFAVARLITTLLLGENNSLALRDGIAMTFTEDWGGCGYRPWAKRFRETGDLLALAELLDNETYVRESYLFMRPMAGSFVAYLVHELGWQKFAQLYQDWPETGLPQILQGESTRQKYEQGWWAFLDAMQHKSASPQKKRDHDPVFQKGFCYAHEGYQIYNGYLSRKSFESLQKLRSFGNTWISVTPFGYLHNPNEPAYFRFSFGAGSENDESLVVAAQYARQLGMNVMLKPHVLMSGPHWGWPGDVKMQTEKEWQAFFKYYYKWIRHYAVLAEIYDFDIFCIGVELLHTTREHQQEWRTIISKIRNLYSGPLTYAANWWEEFEQIQFWDELDYIGLNLYYPLSEQDSVSVEELVAGMNTGMPVVERVVDKFEKPLLLTEVGFTSTRQPWKRPHERVRGAEVYFEHQALCYEAIFRSFWQKPWFYGFYWWKWPTYLEDGGRRHSGFTPNGKLAEQIVEKWYSRPAPSRTPDYSAQ